MKITDACFVAGAVSVEGLPRDPLPQVAFLGPSNVGKSSLLNALLGKRPLARVSRTPGRTQEINFYLVNGAYHFVDLPGYGFAKVPLDVQKRFIRLVEDYLSRSEHLKLLLLLQDARRTPSVRDLELVRWLSANGVPHVILLTKSDKVARGRLKPTCDALRTAFGRPDLPVVPVSALTGDGRKEAWALIDTALGLRSS